MRVAIVHDWLYTIGGAERVLQEMLACYPDADVFCLFDFLKPEDRAKIGLKSTQTSFLQKLPFVKRSHRVFLPLMPIAIEQLDLSPYDLIISSSYAVAKGVLTGPDQLHVSYVHSPIRYAWDLQHTYLARNPNPITSFLARPLLHWLRVWDTRTAHGPDMMIANSHFVARRIRKVYGRKAKVLYPPVLLSTRSEPLPKKGHFLAASRLVPYKNIEAIVRAFAELPDQQLVVAGDGPEGARLRKIAGPNVTFAGFVSDGALRELMATARAFVFAAEEDFGIISVEAQSEGTPVLALGKGGSCETVVDGRTGLFFDTPEPSAIAACVRQFLTREAEFTPENCREQAARFSADRFRDDLRAYVAETISAYTSSSVGYVPGNRFSTESR
ncbi:glycosyltransferase [Gellertiella hungarica]|uniref:Glycosyltransferase involved in cell wall biosynthesis n=1 Tax=Gellertiella hungarica TaxID=1572859 RepID=A0A7W6J840_9HYPH|nr:glycosyltransferase [Gellertiella hungarica]MBB4066539.1 glycosyltransferase involved in cell wall biosynthesis [Gellertiella hungarica]